ncbi:nucleotide pyrophosphohydrolase [Candidatus Poseidoniales archaeon]|nr:nucleotide pyrophosphohydrolase [Candidatus Poseidoniales archaeon]|tara:strand:- start:114 stop:434 length:321 start_codon:yes stop_codon:yes gene_type:complete
MDMDLVLSKIERFVTERDWDKFHSPENLSKSIAIESGELLECFQWGSEGNIEQIQDELADVLIYCFLLARKCELNIDQIVISKLKKSEKKYPINKFKGRSEKYDKI